MIAGYHWFTDWGRDTMISLEGLTLATGRHARGRLHPAHLRALRSRRPDSEHVPRGRERRPLPHRRRDAVVLPRPRPLPRLHPATASRCALCSRAQRHRRAPRARHALRHRRRSARRPAAQGAEGTSSPGWTRRSATGSSRRGAAKRSRSTRSGTTRCKLLEELGRRRRAIERGAVPASTPSGCGDRSTSGSGTPTAAICTT